MDTRQVSGICGGDGAGCQTRIPAIYVNDKEQNTLTICAESSGKSFKFHSSLPDLADRLPQSVGNKDILKISRGTAPANSPRIRKRRFLKSLDLDGFDRMGTRSPSPNETEYDDFAWLKELEVKRKQRFCRGSSSTDSNGTAKSASHVSTCGSRFESFDRLSLPDLHSVHDLRLRRVFSGPLRSARREVKSCSNLSAYLPSFLSDVSKNANLLSPPSLVQSLYGSMSFSSTPSIDNDLADRSRSSEQVYDAAYQKMYELYIAESRHEKDDRIRMWLTDLKMEQGSDVALYSSDQHLCKK